MMMRSVIIATIHGKHGKKLDFIMMSGHGCNVNIVTGGSVMHVLSLGMKRVARGSYP